MVYNFPYPSEFIDRKIISKYNFDSFESLSPHTAKSNCRLSVRMALSALTGLKCFESLFSQYLNDSPNFWIERF